MIEILVAGLTGFVLGWLGKGRFGAKRFREHQIAWQSRVDSVQTELIESRRQLIEFRRRVGELDMGEGGPDGLERP